MLVSWLVSYTTHSWEPCLFSQYYVTCLLSGLLGGSPCKAVAGGKRNLFRRTENRGTPNAAYCSAWSRLPASQADIQQPSTSTAHLSLGTPKPTHQELLVLLPLFAQTVFYMSIQSHCNTHLTQWEFVDPVGKITAGKLCWACNPPFEHAA